MTNHALNSCQVLSSILLKLHRFMESSVVRYLEFFGQTPVIHVGFLSCLLVLLPWVFANGQLIFRLVGVDNIRSDEVQF